MGTRIMGISKKKTSEQLLGKHGEAQVDIWWGSVPGISEQLVKGPKTEMCLKCLKSNEKVRNAVREIRGHRWNLLCAQGAPFPPMYVHFNS